MRNNVIQQIELGGVYTTNFERGPLRVIGLDDKELFYDSFWPHSGTWGLSNNLGRRCTFTRAPLGLFVESAKKLDFIPLSEEEHAVLRPDLPLRLGRNEKLSWHNLDLDSIEKICGSTAKTIAADTLLLTPYGKKGGRMKSVQIKSNTGSGFSEREIVAHATTIQNSVHSSPSKGIGVYRSGFEKRIPTYYIGEFFDEHGYLAQFELG